MKHAVHFGAGNIGRGFLGQLYWETGWETVFVDVARPVVEALNARGAYPLRIVEDDRAETLTIDHVRAIDGTDLDAVATAIASATIVSTAVGVNVLPHIAPALARGIAARFALPDSEPLNIIVCENLLDAGPFLRAAVCKHLPETLHARLEADVGFVEASIGRMVPVMTAEQHAEDPLLVCVEPFCDLPVDAAAFKGVIPAIAHLKPSAPFGAYVEQKLFEHNMSHAATAYLGYLRGHAFISEAIRDAAVRTVVEGALEESCAALARCHGLDLDALRAHAAGLVHRYHNSALGDTIARVARDPVRKLGPRDRLVGAAMLVLEEGGAPRNIALATAAAILYDSPDDPGAVALQNMRRNGGLDTILAEICQVSPGSPFSALVSTALEQLESQFQPR